MTPRQDPTRTALTEADITEISRLFRIATRIEVSVLSPTEASKRLIRYIPALLLERTEAQADDGEDAAAIGRLSAADFSWLSDEVRRDTPARPSPIPGLSSPQGQAEEDPLSIDLRWNEGCDFAMRQLCAFLGVDPQSVNWDAATETLDGDVRAVIGNILRAKLGENWSPRAQPSPEEAPAPAGIQELIAGIEGADKIVLDTDDHRVASVRCTAESVALIVAGLRLLASQPSAPTADTGPIGVPVADRIDLDFEPMADRPLSPETQARLAEIDAHIVRAAAPSPPVSVEQAGKATEAQITAAVDAINKIGAMNRQGVEAALNAALQLSVSPVQETKEEAR